jgi:hypothetical protein
MEDIMNTELIIQDNIEDRIYTIRGMHVMLDRDLAELYGVETKHINQAVRNNEDKFFDDFVFQLTSDEFTILRSNNLTAKFSKTRTNPKVFTEQGIYMLATILKSKIAANVTVSIIRTFANMRKLINSNDFYITQLQELEKRQLRYEITSDNKFHKIFKAIEDKNITPTQGIFYDGQIFDAYVFINDLLKSVKEEVVLVDNYIDESVLTLFSKYPDIKFTLISSDKNKRLKLDIKKYNSQYNNLTLKHSTKYHDRFLIIDKTTYHLGASLKDLGKKVFAFSKMAQELKV